MAQLQENIIGIISTFSTYARRDGDCSTLGKGELRQLIRQEFADVIANPHNLETVEKVLCFLDDDSNDRVDFSEFLSLVFRVAKACYKELRQCQRLESGQEPTAQEEAGSEQQPAGPHAAERVSHCHQVREKRANNQVQEAETPDTHQTQEAEMQDQEPDIHQTHQPETPDWEPGTRQADGTEAPEWDPKRGEILQFETAEQNRNTCQAEENGTPEQDPGTHQAQETETPEQSLNNHQAQDAETLENTSSSHQVLEMESAEQDLNCPSETPGRDTSDENQVREAPQQDPNPGEAQKLQLLEQDVSPSEGAEPQETHHDLALRQSHEPEVLEQELSGGDEQFCPAQDQQDDGGQRQPAAEQAARSDAYSCKSQNLQPFLYQWPPQQ
ncbi:cornulin-like [Dromaius novaehollandiae]|uniref:cornulin-like n=1 Tax=Dromaius novaehollandiae TaxID=8790 RepID=UPI00311F7156